MLNVNMQRAVPRLFYTEKIGKQRLLLLIDHVIESPISSFIF